MASRIRTRENNQIFENYDNFAYIEVPITKDDTLLALSVKFNCTLIDLKRLNSLQNDREMYALNSFKIPIKKHSILAQEYETQLKYGEINFSRLKTNTVSDPKLENDVYVNSEDTEDDNEEILSNKKFSLEREARPSNNSASRINLEEYDKVDEYEFSEKSNLMNTGLGFEKFYDAKKNMNMKNKQSKDAKRFLKIKDKEVSSLIHKNDKIINNIKSSNINGEQLIPISNFSIESDRTRVNINSTYFNVRDAILLACFIIIIIPLAIFIYRSYFEEPY